MSFGEIFYYVAIVGFAWITFAIVRGNFRRKFDEQGRRKDLIEDSEKESSKVKSEE